MDLFAAKVIFGLLSRSLYKLTVLTGLIQCRLTSNPSHLQSLGRHLQDSLDQPQNIYFVIVEKYREHEAQRLPLDQITVEMMIRQEKFTLGFDFQMSREYAEVDIQLSVGDGPRFSISGCPQTIQQDNGRKGTILIQSPRDISNLVPTTEYYRAVGRTRLEPTLSKRGRGVRARKRWEGPHPDQTNDMNDALASFSAPNYVVRNQTRSLAEAHTERALSQYDQPQVTTCYDPDVERSRAVEPQDNEMPELEDNEIPALAELPGDNSFNEC